MIVGMYFMIFHPQIRENKNKYLLKNHRSSCNGMVPGSSYIQTYTLKFNENRGFIRFSTILINTISLLI